MQPPARRIQRRVRRIQRRVRRIQRRVRKDPTFPPTTSALRLETTRHETCLVWCDNRLCTRRRPKHGLLRPERLPPLPHRQSTGVEKELIRDIMVRDRRRNPNDSRYSGRKPSAKELQDRLAHMPPDFFCSTNACTPCIVQAHAQQAKCSAVDHRQPKSLLGGSYETYGTFSVLEKPMLLLRDSILVPLR